MVAAASLLATFAAGCGDDDAAGGSGGGGGADDPIVFGVVMPETGDFGSVGVEAVAGIEAAVAELNADGGILGREVQVEVRDSQSNANKGILAVQELIDNFDPAFMVPDTISSIAQGTQPLTTDAEIPSASAASAPELGDVETYPFHFQAFVDSTLQAEAVYAGLEAKGATKVGIISSNDAAGEVASSTAEENLPEYGFDVVGTETFEPGATDLTVQLQRLKSAGADGLFVHAIGQDNGTVMSAIEGLGWDDVVAVADASSLSGDLAEIIPEGVQDQFFTLSARSTLAGPDAEARFAMFSEHGDISSLQVPSINYDIVMLAAWAMEEAGSTESADIVAALEGLEGTADEDLPELIYFPNPGWSESVHNLTNADFTEFWGLVEVAPPVDGAYQGEDLTLIEP
jgi:branched-chain amino acid transport system substrate-binding protein